MGSKMLCNWFVKRKICLSPFREFFSRTVAVCDSIICTVLQENQANVTSAKPEIHTQCNKNVRTWKYAARILWVGELLQYVLFNYGDRMIGKSLMGVVLL